MILSAQMLSLALAANIALIPETDDETLKALKACAILKNNVTRLGCYDSLLRPEVIKKKKEEATAKFGLNKKYSPLTAPVRPSQPAKPSVQSPDKSPGKNVSSSDKTAPSPERIPAEKGEKKPSMAKRILNAFLKKDIEEEKVTSITIEMVSHKKNRKGKYVFRMKDGAQWVQTDGFRRPLKKGPFLVTIKEGTFGSYILSPEKGSWSVRVMRIK